MRKISCLLVASILITSCSTKSDDSSNASAKEMTIQEIAGRSLEPNEKLWDDEDIRTIAAQTCIAYKPVFDRALGDLFLQWEELFAEYWKVAEISAKIPQESKWYPLNEQLIELLLNSANRAKGGDGTPITPSLAVKVFNLCDELGLNINE